MECLSILAAAAAGAAAAADVLPSEWLLGDLQTYDYTGMALTHFICRYCKWSAAADPGLQMQRDLVWLDISFNNLAAPYNILPAQWDELPLVTLKVRLYWANNRADIHMHLARWQAGKIFGQWLWWTSPAQCTFSCYMSRTVCQGLQWPSTACPVSALRHGGTLIYTCKM